MTKNVDTDIREIKEDYGIKNSVPIEGGDQQKQNNEEIKNSTPIEEEKQRENNEEIKNSYEEEKENRDNEFQQKINIIKFNNEDASSNGKSLISSENKNSNKSNIIIKENIPNFIDKSYSDNSNNSKIKKSENKSDSEKKEENEEKKNDLEIQNNIGPLTLEKKKNIDKKQ